MTAYGFFNGRRASPPRNCSTTKATAIISVGFQCQLFLCRSLQYRTLVKAELKISLLWGRQVSPLGQYQFFQSLHLQNWLNLIWIRRRPCLCHWSSLQHPRTSSRCRRHRGSTLRLFRPCRATLAAMGIASLVLLEELLLYVKKKVSVKVEEDESLD